MNKMINKYKSGFTLIELLVVIAIIGILSTLAIVSLNTAREKARDAKRISDVKQVQTSLELYFSDKNGYPAGDGLVLGGASALALSVDNGFSATGAGTIYMGQVPKNPTPNGADYAFTSYTDSTIVTKCLASPCAWYQITFNLEKGAGTLGAGARTASPTGIQ